MFENTSGVTVGKGHSWHLVGKSQGGRPQQRHLQPKCPGVCPEGRTWAARRPNQEAQSPGTDAGHHSDTGAQPSASPPFRPYISYYMLRPATQTGCFLFIPFLNGMFLVTCFFLHTLCMVAFAKI